MRWRTLFGLALLLSACGDDDGSPDAGDADVQSPDGGDANVDADTDADGMDAEVDAGPIEPTFENVDMVIRRSCTFSNSCHGGPGMGQGQLNFALARDAGEPFTAALQMADGMPRPACEYDLLPLIDPGNPDGSWLMIKVGGPMTMGVIDFTPDAAWDPFPGETPGSFPPSECPLTEGGNISFGRRMPLDPAGMTTLPEREIELFREWIRAGAPGPS
ncbi:MAG: hypothetical protein AAGF12_15915 [Myxococcota bacterium]